jgi:hypothetical protein
MASALPAASIPRPDTPVLEARSLRGLRHDAEESLLAETISEARALPPWCAHGRRDGRIQALGRCHIGGGAYLVWALPPNVRGTPHRHGQVQSHTHPGLSL